MDVDNVRMSRERTGNAVTRDQTATFPDHFSQGVWNTTAHLEMQTFPAIDIEIDWLYSQFQQIPTVGLFYG